MSEDSDTGGNPNWNKGGIKRTERDSDHSNIQCNKNNSRNDWRNNIYIHRETYIFSVKSSMIIIENIHFVPFTKRAHVSGRHCAGDKLFR